MEVGIFSEETTSNSYPDIENLLKRAELENSEQVKLIETENHKLQELQRLLEEKTRQTEELEKSTTDLNNQAKELHRLFKQNQEINDSLKKNNTLLNEHEESLQRKYENNCSELHALRVENTKTVDRYKSVWEKYHAFYEQSPNAVDLTHTKNAVHKSQKEVSELEDQLGQLEIRLEDAKIRKSKTEVITKEYQEHGDNPTISSLVRLAELYKKVKCTVEQGKEKSVQLRLTENELQRIEEEVPARNMIQENINSEQHMECENIQETSDLDQQHNLQDSISEVNTAEPNRTSVDVHMQSFDQHPEGPLSSNRKTMPPMPKLMTMKQALAMPSFSIGSAILSQTASTASPTVSDNDHLMTTSSTMHPLSATQNRVSTPNSACEQITASRVDASNTHSSQPTKYYLGSQLQSFTNFNLSFNKSRLVPDTSRSDDLSASTSVHSASKAAIITTVASPQPANSSPTANGSGNQQRKDGPRVFQNQQDCRTEGARVISSETRGTSPGMSSQLQDAALVNHKTTEKTLGVEQLQEPQPTLSGTEFVQQDPTPADMQGKSQPKTPTKNSIDDLLAFSDFERLKQLKKSPGEGFHFERRPMFNANEETQRPEVGSKYNDQSNLLQSFLFGNDTKPQPQQVDTGISSMFGMGSPVEKNKTGPLLDNGFFMDHQSDGGNEAQNTSSSAFSFFGDDGGGSSIQQNNQPQSPGFSFNFAGSGSSPGPSENQSTAFSFF